MAARRVRARRDALPEDLPFLRHIGIYAYRAGFLRRFAATAADAAGTVESLEQLRALEHGFAIAVREAPEPFPPGVDTAEDLARVERILARTAPMTRILFVCMGNICRSPMVETVARVELARAGIEAEVASAGTESYHVGEGADPRAIEIAEANGYPLAQHRARQVAARISMRYDLILAMDRVNLGALRRHRPRDATREPRCSCRMSVSASSTKCPIRTTARGAISSTCSISRAAARRC